MVETSYPGQELESFAAARHWKAYVRHALHPYIEGDVLEVGAGRGETAKALRPGSRALGWTCLEPDGGLVTAIETLAGGGELGSPVAVKQGTLADLPGSADADTVLYVDVLEHIEDDAGELRNAAARLRPRGRIVVLSPAYPMLYSAFDEAIGHFRRYTGAMLRAVAPADLREEALFYLDSVGLFASLANRLLLKQSLPTFPQVHTWDRFMVPVSRLVDPLVGKRFGRSVVIVWRKA